MTDDPKVGELQRPNFEHKSTHIAEGKEKIQN